MNLFKIYLLILLTTSCSSKVTYENQLEKAKKLYEQGDNIGSSDVIREVLTNKDITLEQAFPFEKLQAKIYQKEKFYQTSINLINRIIDYQPNDTDLYYTRASCYQDLSEYKLALKDYTNIISINNKSADAYNKRGLVHYKLFQYKEARRDIDSALLLTPNNPDALNNKAILISTFGEHKKAIEYLKKSYYIKPQKTKLFNLGIIFKDLKQYDSACHYWKLALDSVAIKSNKYIIKYCN